MRLQSAIFTLPDALLDGGALRPGADKVLSILKMESVWLYAVTALDRTEAQALLVKRVDHDLLDHAVLLKFQSGGVGTRRRAAYHLHVVAAPSEDGLEKLEVNRAHVRREDRVPRLLHLLREDGVMVYRRFGLGCE